MESHVIGLATLYCGDCTDILPTLDTFDAVVTDPPYGIGKDGGRASTSKNRGRKAYDFLGWDSKTPDACIFEEIFRLSKNQVIWGANYFPEHLPPSMGWLFWDKGQRISQSDGELAYTSMQKALRVFTLNRAALTHEGAVHPTQKPLALMKWCINQIDIAQTILDPFMGSGTTGVAAIQLGRAFTGIEREPKYFDIACKRIEQAYAQGQLFEPVQAKQEQVSLI